MNYSYPYFYPIPPTPSRGILSALFGGRAINWGTILNNTQRTLGIVNQAIPLVKQAGPVMKNAKTMFKIMNEFKKVDTPVITPAKASVTESASDEVSQELSYDGGPTFFA